MPPIAHALLRLLPVPRSVPAALAMAHLRANPGQIAVSAAAMITSVSLMVSMAIMVASFRQSFDDWLEVMLPADLYLRAGTGDDAVFSVRQRGEITGTPGIARAEFMRVTSLLIDPAQPRVALLARDIDPRDPAARLAIVGTAIPVPPRAPPPAWVSEAWADRQALATGNIITLPIAGRSHRVHGRRHLARLCAAAGRDRHRAQALCRVDRRRHGQPGGTVARPGCACGGRAPRARRAPGAGIRGRRDDRRRPAAALARRIRPDFRAHLRARSGGGRDRAGRAVGGTGRADARAPAASSACFAISA